MKPYELDCYDIFIGDRTYGIDANLYLEISKFGYVDIETVEILRVTDSEGNNLDFAGMTGTIEAQIRNNFDQHNSALYNSCERFYEYMKG